MPSRYSSLSSLEDSNKLAKNLNVEMQDIPIDHMYQQYLNLLSPIFLGKAFDTTEEKSLLVRRLFERTCSAPPHVLSHSCKASGPGLLLAIDPRPSPGPQGLARCVSSPALSLGPLRPSLGPELRVCTPNPPACPNVVPIPVGPGLLRRGNPGPTLRRREARPACGGRWG